MKGYRLNKRYILKIMISRLIIIATLNIVYGVMRDKLPLKLDFYLIILLYAINVIGTISIVIMPFVEFLAYKYFVYDEAIEIRYGVLFRKSVYIPRENIKYIISVKDPLDRILRISSLKLYTTAGHRVIKALGNEKMSALWNIMNIDEEN
ncbi:MAG: PH domain-containing protein [Sarcina sp.]